MKMSSGSRKRTVAPRDEGDPATFLDEYFRDRGISGRHDSEAAREVQMRAEQARERFKRMRTEAASSTAATAATNATNAATSAATGLDADTLTKEQKYNRRLANNRKSAAASRVYNEVLRKETDFTLKEVVEKSKRYESTIANMNNQLEESHKENERIKKRLAKLEEALQKTGTPAPDAAPNSVKKEESRITKANVAHPYGTNNSNSNSNMSVGARTASASGGGGTSVLSGGRTGMGAGSAITTGSGSVVPRMPTLSQASSGRAHGAHSASHVSNLPRLPPLRPVPGEFPVIPSLFGASSGASNAILRLSQTSTPSNSQEEDHSYQYNKAMPAVQQLIAHVGTLGGSQDTVPRFSYPASQDHPPVQPFSLSQDLNKSLHLGSQEPDQSHRMSQEIIGADVTPSQS